MYVRWHAVVALLPFHVVCSIYADALLINSLIRLFLCLLVCLSATCIAGDDVHAFVLMCHRSFYN
jgi:hypothetical protein